MASTTVIGNMAVVCYVVTEIHNFAIQFGCKERTGNTRVKKLIGYRAEGITGDDIVTSTYFYFFTLRVFERAFN